MDLKESELLGNDIGDHWYYRSKAKAMVRLLSGVFPSTILDVGAGSGFFSKTLLSESCAQEAWCVDKNYADESNAFVAGKPVRFRCAVEEINADLVLLMDVLEHVDDDVGFLRDYVKKVSCGTRFLVTVPAFPFLWSGHDVFLEHKRRYRLAQVEDVVRQAGLTVKHGSYYFGAVFPIAATIRLASKLTWGARQRGRSQLSQHHPLVNGALAAMSRAELPFFAHNRLVGLTAFCLAEKPGPKEARR